MKKILLVIISIMLSATSLYSQETGGVTGYVTSGDGETLMGVNISLEGTSYGAASDAEGHYMISDIPVGDYTLRATYIGFEPVSKSISIKPDETVQLNITMNRKALRGEEIVVIGYGVQQQRDLLGASNTVEAAELEKMQTNNVLNALQGKLSGVTIENSSGSPGASPNVKIRGIGTLNDATPLYIIDGVPGDINSVDPADIQSIRVLKDASASSIYGSRAANGVVLIETKSGKKGQPMSWTFSTSYGMQNMRKRFDVLNAKEHMEVVGEAVFDRAEKDPDYAVPKYFQDYKADPEGFLASHPNTDWQDVYYRENVPTKKYHLAVSGGGENGNYRISGTYNDTKGIIIDTWQEDWNIRVKSDWELNKFKIGETITLTRNKQEQVGAESGGRDANSVLLMMPPVVSPYDDDADGWGGPPAGQGYTDVAVNVAGTNSMNSNIWDETSLTAIGYMSYEIIDNLVYKLRGKYGFTDGYWQDYTPTYEMGYRTYNYDADLSESTDRTSNTLLESFLNYNNQFGSHNIRSLLGYSFEQTNWNTHGASIEGFPASGIKAIDAGLQNPSQWGSRTTTKIESMFGRVFYSFQDKYLLKYTLRRDGNSKFAKENRYGNFPSYGIGWRISEEPFFDIVPYSEMINNLKFRFNYGVLGNAQIDNYEYIPTVSISSDPDGNLNYPTGTGEIRIGAAIASFPSYGIQWEETITKGFGMDLSLLQDKIMLAAEYYVKTTEGILYNTPIPYATGVSEGPRTNLASVENSGLEFDIKYNNYLEDIGLNYSINANLKTIHNEVKKLGTEDETVWSGTVRDYQSTKTQVGDPIGAFYVYETAGLFQSQEEIDNYTGPDGNLIQPDAAPGDIKFVDANNDGQLSKEDKTFHGSALPDFEYGLSFSGSYKNFDLAFTIHGVEGKKMYNGTRWWTESMDRHVNWSAASKNAWSEDNKNTNVPRAVIGDPNMNNRASERFLEDASYLEMQHIQIGYTIPKDFNIGFGESTVRIFASAENLFCLSGYKGYDPTVTGGSLFSRGVDVTTYPTARILRAGIVFDFK